MPISKRRRTIHPDDNAFKIWYERFKEHFFRTEVEITIEEFDRHIKKQEDRSRKKEGIRIRNHLF